MDYLEMISRPKKKTFTQYSLDELLKKKDYKMLKRNIVRFVGMVNNRINRYEKGERRLVKDFYNSKKWRQVRYEALKNSNRVCLLCKATNKQLHVDHIKPRSKFPELQYDLNNLQVLCADCNVGKSNLDDTSWKDPQPAVV